MLSKILIILGSIVFFIAGCEIYGFLLNTGSMPLAGILQEKRIKSLANPMLVANRKTNSLELYEDSMLVKRYRAVFGRTAEPKKFATDRGTPRGEYKILKIDLNHLYHRFLLIDYPNEKDLADSYRSGSISRRELNDLKDLYYYGGLPDSITQFGNKLGIHGTGKLNSFFKNLPFVFNWTDGSIALSNEDIDEIITVVHPGTPVIIR